MPKLKKGKNLAKLKKRSRTSEVQDQLDAIVLENEPVDYEVLWMELKIKNEIENSKLKEENDNLIFRLKTSDEAGQVLADENHSLKSKMNDLHEKLKCKPIEERSPSYEHYFMNKQKYDNIIKTVRLTHIYAASYLVLFVIHNLISRFSQSDHIQISSWWLFRIRFTN